MNIKKKNDHGVFAAVRMAAASHRFLTVGTVLCVAASVAASLLPPLLLARVIDRLTAGLPLSFLAVLLYFGSLALEGVLTSAQESLLVLFGQRMTHALRSEMSRKLSRLPAGTLAEQNPGEVAARFSGDVDTVEALFTSGIISMAADACRIVSIMGVIAVKNTGLALILLLVLPLFAVFTRYVQKRMLAAQLDNRRAVAAVSGQVPETLHNIRTIRALGLEDYMERRYDRCIGDSYAAMERTNFYDAVYSPVVLLLNAVVVGIVMLLSASGNAQLLTLFGMSVGTSVAVINYISRIFAPIESLGMEIQTIQSAMAGVRRIDAFLDQPERTIPPACRAPCWNRSRWETRRSPGKWQGLPPHWPGSMLPSGLCRRAMTPSVLRASSRRASGSCCPLPVPPLQIPPCCCWMRSPPIWMPKPRPACWRLCAVPPRAARCSPSPTASMKILAAERSRSGPGNDV